MAKNRSERENADHANKLARQLDKERAREAAAANGVLSCCRSREKKNAVEERLPGVDISMEGATGEQGGLSKAFGDDVINSAPTAHESTPEIHEIPPPLERGCCGVSLESTRQRTRQNQV